MGDNSPPDAERTMGDTQIANLLVEHGRELLATKKPGSTTFTPDPRANRLINDLGGHPHAFVLGCVMDRQVKAQLAWLIPYRVSKKLGDFKFSTLRRLWRGQVRRLMTKPEPLHRFPEKMSGDFHAAIGLIDHRYEGDAASIWTGRLSSADVVYRFLEFQGVGPKVASMAANILAREFKIPLSDYHSIDISVDRHVRRVFTRLGLVRKGATPEELIYRARALHPEYPGVIDLPAWQIGKNWCRPTRTLCESCYMHIACPATVTTTD
jgi:hypothetical protein